MRGMFEALEGLIFFFFKKIPKRGGRVEKLTNAGLGNRGNRGMKRVSWQDV